MLGPRFPEVLARARAGDELAWGELYDDLAGPLIGFLRGRGTADPEDQLGETLLQIARNLAGFQGDEAGFRAWVFTIAHRRSVDALRAQGRRPATVLPSEELTLLADALTRGEDEFGQVVDRIAATARIEALLEHLTDEQREVLVLRFAGDLDATTVGQITGRSTNAVAAITARALLRLREVLELGGQAPSPALARRR